MESGDLNNVLVLQRKVTSRDAMGGEVITYTVVVTVYGNAQPIRGREFMSLLASDAEIDVRFTIYYREDIDATWRIKWRNRQYDIVAPPIDIDGNKQWLEIMCRTSQAMNYA